MKVYAVIYENLFDRSGADDPVSSVKLFHDPKKAREEAELLVKEVGYVPVYGEPAVWYDEDETAGTIRITEVEVK